MLTINEIVKQKQNAKIKNVESIFLESLFDEVLEIASNGSTISTTYFDAFKNKTHFEFFVKVVKETIENNFTVKGIVTDIVTNTEDYELEVNFDLQKESTL